MRPNRSIIAVAIFGLALTPGPAAPDSQPLEPAERIDRLMAPWADADSPGAAIAVVRDGAVVFKRGYGSAQLEYGIPITPATVFHVASVSKQFTAFAVVLLARQGKLSLDDDIRKYVPEVPDLGKKITLRHLIHHTGGLREAGRLLSLAGWRLDDAATLEDVLSVLARQRELNFDPGEEFRYSNTGYVLLAETVARVSGKSFSEWSAEHIFEPLEMTRSAFHDDYSGLIPQRAYSYDPDGTGSFGRVIPSKAPVGAIGLFTTAEDLVRWLGNFESAKLGGKAATEQMFERGVLNAGTETSYGFGLGHSEHLGLSIVGHDGDTQGFRSIVLSYPSRRFSVVVLSNVRNFDPQGIALQIAGFYLGDETARAPEPVPANHAEAGPEGPGAPLDDYLGEYLLDGLPVTILRDGDRLMGQVPGQDPVELTPDGKDAFLLAENKGRTVFHRDEGGTVVGQTYTTPDLVELSGKRLKLAVLTTADLAQYAGRYYSSELDTTYALVVKDDRLVATHLRHGEITLTPARTDEFSGDRRFFSSVAFERDAEGLPKSMLVSTGRMRPLRFARQPDSAIE
jgi:CubicO group peptidase (beta-lactamase class C family)